MHIAFKKQAGLLVRTFFAENGIELFACCCQQAAHVSYVLYYYRRMPLLYCEWLLQTANARHSVE